MRLYLSSGERNGIKEVEVINEIKPPYLLVAFDSLRGREKVKEWVRNWVNSPWCKDLMLDSGAFSLGRSKSNINWDQYVDEYIDFINSTQISHFFELDIDDLLGIEKVEEIRKRLERRTGKQSIPVWHKNRGWKYFEKMCEEYDYVSIGGMVRNPIRPKIIKTFPYFIDYAHKKGCRIHGLGFTTLKKLRKLNFDSVDSSSWKSGAMYGNIYQLQGSGLVSVRDKFPGKRLMGSKLYKYNLEMWANYARFIDTW